LKKFLEAEELILIRKVKQNHLILKILVSSSLSYQARNILGKLSLYKGIGKNIIKLEKKQPEKLSLCQELIY